MYGLILTFKIFHDQLKNHGPLFIIEQIIDGIDERVDADKNSITSFSYNYHHLLGAYSTNFYKIVV